MGFMDKTYEQLLAEMKEWPADEFLSYLRSDVLGLVSSILNGFPIMEQIIERGQFEQKEDLLKIFQGIQRNAQYVRNLMDALGTYDQERRA